MGRTSAAAAVVDGMVYVIAGRIPSGENTSFTEVTNPILYMTSPVLYMIYGEIS